MLFQVNFSLCENVDYKGKSMNNKHKNSEM